MDALELVVGGRRDRRALQLGARRFSACDDAVGHCPRPLRPLGVPLRRMRIRAHEVIGQQEDGGRGRHAVSVRSAG